MTLNSSGAISLNGTTVGESIAIELGLTGTSSLGLNTTTVRTLAGIASGTIIMPTDFYGKTASRGLYYAGISLGANSNVVTRINTCGALFGSETTAGTARECLAGAKVGSNGLFYGGYIITVCAPLDSNLVTRINACGALVGSQTNVGTARYTLSGASVGSNGLFYGGNPIVGCCTNIVTRINACGSLVGSETTAGTARYALDGAGVGSNGVFYGGVVCNICTGVSNLVTRINACGALVGSQTNVGTARYYLSGTLVGSNAVFYGGRLASGNYSNTVTRINSCGALVGAQTAIGTSRGLLGSATVGVNGIFYGGTYPNSNTATRINACGALVGSQTNVGNVRYALAGAGV